MYLSLVWFLQKVTAGLNRETSILVPRFQGKIISDLPSRIFPSTYLPICLNVCIFKPLKKPSSHM